MSSNRDARYTTAGRALGELRYRNRSPVNGGCGCPIIIEGRRDRIALKVLGFTGPIEHVNRGWMDWDRTGGQLQKKLGERFEAFGMRVDNDTRMELIRSMKPEGRTVEGLKAHADNLRPYIDIVDPEGIEKE